MNENHIREIVENMIEAADELLEKGRANLNCVEYRELPAYAESLCMVRDTLSGYDLAAVGLDFDIDSRYLQ